MSDKPETPTTTDATVSEQARALAAQRRIVDSNCEVCGTPIRGTKKRRYCSNRCRVAAFRRAVKREEEGGQS